MTTLETPLDALHRELGARMVPFAGYAMPVQYPSGIIKEHLHTRQAAGLFDVSHMGQVKVTGPHSASELESITPAALMELAPMHASYTLLTNEEGGVRDDLIVTRLDDNSFMLVLNAACKHEDLKVIRAACESSDVEYLHAQALLALQGPSARDALAGLIPDVRDLAFMQACWTTLDGISCLVSCSGYTGEDGFELSIPATDAERIARRLLAQTGVAPIGLGARDSLRLEAGLCLYGHELSAATTPVSAGLRWAIAKPRRPDGSRAGGYPGADVIQQELAAGSDRVRIGLQVDGKRPVREGQVIYRMDGEAIGEVTSGGFGPSVGAPIAMGYVARGNNALDTPVQIDVRGQWITARVVKLPMIVPGYHRG